jgi:hypothetical protein
MRSLETRLEALEAKHWDEPIVMIIRCVGAEMGRVSAEMNDEEFIGYDSYPESKPLVRRLGGETDEELLARAKAACTGNAITLLAVWGRWAAPQPGSMKEASCVPSRAD